MYSRVRKLLFDLETAFFNQCAHLGREGEEGEGEEEGGRGRGGGGRRGGEGEERRGRGEGERGEGKGLIGIKGWKGEG